ncbi:MAG: hypothetical protein Q8S39_03010, partial [Ignavibacteria bacterium]|nr:hypothetical protein [Ignavibacteria bacterium]
MKQISKSLLAIFLVLILTSPSIFSQSVDPMIDEVDDYYKQFNNEKALEVLKKAEKAEPNNFEVIWRMSRTLVDIAEKMPTSTDQQEEAQIAMYQKALEYAEKAVKTNSNSSLGFLRRAIANGKIALFKGVFSVAGVVNSVKADVEKAIA